MAKDTQISAIISETTRELLEKHVRQTGVKKGHLVEQALLHHLQAFTPFEPLEGQSDARPRSTAMWLPIQAIKAASAAVH